MAGVRFIEHRGRRICYIDFENAQPADVPPVIRDAKRLIASQSPRSVLTLTNVSNAHYDHAVTNALTEFAAHNKPFVKAGAVVGVTGLKKLIYQAVVTFTGRNLHLFDSVPAAQDWLARQP